MLSPLYNYHRILGATRPKRPPTAPVCSWFRPFLAPSRASTPVTPRPPTPRTTAKHAPTCGRSGWGYHRSQRGAIQPKPPKGDYWPDCDTNVYPLIPDVVAVATTPLERLAARAKAKQEALDAADAEQKKASEAVLVKMSVTNDCLQSVPSIVDLAKGKPVLTMSDTCRRLYDARWDASLPEGEHKAAVATWNDYSYTATGATLRNKPETFNLKEQFTRLAAAREDERAKWLIDPNRTKLQRA